MNLKVITVVNIGIEGRKVVIFQEFVEHTACNGLVDHPFTLRKLQETIENVLIPTNGIVPVSGRLQEFKKILYGLLNGTLDRDFFV